MQICTVLLVYKLTREHRRALDTEEYVSLYSGVKRPSIIKEEKPENNDAEADIDAIIARQEEKQRKGEEDDGDVD